MLSNAVLQNPCGLTAEKPRLTETLAQSLGGLQELQKVMFDILARLQGPMPQAAEKLSGSPSSGSVGVAVEIRSQVMRLQDLAQNILAEL